MICSACGGEHERLNQRYCSPCHASYMREWRKTHPLGIEQKKRDAARSYANVYKRRGVLSRTPCEICGDVNSEMHHPDHELPLVVVWLCWSCHLDWHAIFREIAADAWSFWQAKAKAAKAGTKRNDQAA
ncbi:MAG TPA: hypothetical protein VNU68_15125 [Verrucomicrobiae bacterium]|nr:hypothetical protein [Verrucomicrobiae bacterium]